MSNRIDCMRVFALIYGQLNAETISVCLACIKHNISLEQETSILWQIIPCLFSTMLSCIVLAYVVTVWRFAVYAQFKKFPSACHLAKCMFIKVVVRCYTTNAYWNVHRALSHSRRPSHVVSNNDQALHSVRTNVSIGMYTIYTRTPHTHQPRDCLVEFHSLQHMFDIFLNFIE